MIVGFAIAVAITGIARKRALLSSSGAVTAVILGTLSMGAGLRWGVLLVVYFVAATTISRWRRAEKAARTHAIVEKRGARDAWQVFANGGVFVLAALIAAVSHSTIAIGAALGALASSMADTTATEIGSAFGGEPRSILSGQKVAAGFSGGVTAVGSLAMLVGSAAIGTFSFLVGFSAQVVVAAVAGGIVGALADSLLGAVMQERRCCPVCGMLTERRSHDCRSSAVATDVVGGVRGFDNDWVNLTSTAIGGLVAAVLSRGGV